MRSTHNHSWEENVYQTFLASAVRVRKFTKRPTNSVHAKLLKGKQASPMNVDSQDVLYKNSHDGKDDKDDHHSNVANYKRPLLKEIKQEK